MSWDKPTIDDILYRPNRGIPVSSPWDSLLAGPFEKLGSSYTGPLKQPPTEKEKLEAAAEQRRHSLMRAEEAAKAAKQAEEEYQKALAEKEKAEEAARVKALNAVVNKSVLNPASIPEGKRWHEVELSEWESQAVEWSRFYAKCYSHGAPGHGYMHLIDHLATILDKKEGFHQTYGVTRTKNNGTASITPK